MARESSRVAGPFPEHATAHLGNRSDFTAVRTVFLRLELRGITMTVRAAELKILFIEAITPDAVRQLAGKLLEMALDGDLQAAKLLLNVAFKDLPVVATVVPVDGGGRGLASRIVERIQAARLVEK